VTEKLGPIAQSMKRLEALSEIQSDAAAVREQLGILPTEDLELMNDRLNMLEEWRSTASARIAQLEAEMRNLQMAYRAALARMDRFQEDQATHGDRLRTTSATTGEIYVAMTALKERVDGLESEHKAEESEYIHDLRRVLLIIGLAETIWDGGCFRPNWLWDQVDWDAECAEFYRRYGHLMAGERPLWTKPPKAPSPETKALIAESLKRREA
jgi:hypothetical protein